MAVIDTAEDHLGMTDEQWAIFHRATHGFGEQDANGIDLASLRENLRLTPTERLRRHQQALGLSLEVRRAGNTARSRRLTENI